MTGVWNSILILLEARPADRIKDDILKHITRRYGENAAEEAAPLLRMPMSPQARFELETTYFDSKLNSLLDELTKGRGGRAAKGSSPDVADAPEVRPRGPDVEPGSSRDKGSGTAGDDGERIPAEPIVQRPDRAGTRANVPALAPVQLRPGERPQHAVGTAGQNAPKPQPSLGEVPPLPKDKRVPPNRSEKEKQQAQVDYATLTYGVEAGNLLAKKFRVPTTAERGGEVDPEDPKAWATDPETERELRPRILKPDALARRGDADASSDGTSWSRPSKDEPGAFVKGRGGVPTRADDPSLPPPRRKGESPPRRHVHKPMLRNKETGELTVRPGQFIGQRWKPHGMAQKKVDQRPDPATLDFQRQVRFTNPAEEGNEVVWDGEDWLPMNPATIARVRKRREELMAQGGGQAKPYTRTVDQQGAKGARDAGDTALLRKAAGSPRIQQQMRSIRDRDRGDK